MKLTKRRILLALVICLLLAFSLGLVAAAGEMLPRSLVSSGGGSTANSELTLQASLAQPIANTVTNEFTLCAGFYCGAGVTETVVNYNVYLPAVIR
jgi:hypothetical protein